MAKATTFVVDGVTFEQLPLDVDQACEGFELLTRTMGQATLDAIVNRQDDPAGDARMMVAVLANASLFSKMLALFAPKAKVSRTPEGAFATGGMLVDLHTFKNDVFGGRLDLLTGYLAQAVKTEYGAFLSALGSGRVAALVAPQG